MSAGGELRGYHSEIYALPDATFVLLRDLVLERTGMFFDEPKRRLLADKLSDLVAANGLTGFLDYYYLLRYDDKADAHWGALIDRLSVPETYFWRQSEQIRALSEVVAPMHFAAHPGQPLRIWSAACCTGEEPLSLAIALDDAGLLGRHPIQIVGTDASSAMLDRARTSLYGPRSFRQLPEPLREKYFVADGERWRPRDHIRAAVRYERANLAVRADVERHASADVIFCRNVFIYFSDEAIQKVVRIFRDRMPPDGCVFLGAAESLTRLGADLVLAEIGDAFAYVTDDYRRRLEHSMSGATAARNAMHRSPGSK